MAIKTEVHISHVCTHKHVHLLPARDNNNRNTLLWQPENYFPNALLVTTEVLKVRSLRAAQLLFQFALNLSGQAYFPVPSVSDYDHIKRWKEPILRCFVSVWSHVKDQLRPSLVRKSGCIFSVSHSCKILSELAGELATTLGPIRHHPTPSQNTMTNILAWAFELVWETCIRTHRWMRNAAAFFIRPHRF